MSALKEYHISFEDIQQEIESVLDVPEEQLSDEQRQLIDAYLEELANAEASKVDGFGKFLRFADARAKACREEAQRLAEKARSIEKRIEKIKNYYANIMDKYGLKKIDGNVYTLSTRMAERLEIDETLDLTSLPNIYVRKTVDIKPDKKAIKAAIKGGLAVTGCEIVKSTILHIK